MAQHRSRADLTAYGKQTKKYISAMHYAALALTTKAIDLSKNHGLLGQNEWKANVLSLLNTLSSSSRRIQHIRPVPKGLTKVDRDLAKLGMKMEAASSKYRAGIKSANGDMIYDAIMSMKEVDDVFVALGDLRHGR